MSTAYELLGIGPDATRQELEAAYAAKQAAYAPERHATLPEDFQQLAAERRAQFAAAYHSLRPALAAPPRLVPAAERRRDRETMLALLVLALLAAVVPLLSGIAVPERSVQASGAEAAALTSDVAPDFTLKTLDGQSVRLADFNTSLEMAVQRGDVELRPAMPLPKMDVDVRNGSVDLAIPGGAKFALKAQVAKGEVENDYGEPLRVSDEGRGGQITGAVGEGPSIAITTERGRVLIRKADDTPPLSPLTPRPPRAPMPPRSDLN